MRIHLTEEQYNVARRALAELEHAPLPVQHLESVGMMLRGDVARLTGLSSSTLAAMAKGKRPSKTQMGALKFALLVRLMNL